MSEYVNPCGGVKWRTLSDGRIELEDGSIPTYSPTSPDFRLLLLTWQNWAPQFRKAAKEYGIPAEWLVSIATCEVGFLAHSAEKQRTVVSSDGYSSVGIMQPIPSTAKLLGYTPDDRYDAQANINMGAALLVLFAKEYPQTRFGFPIFAAMYNGGPGKTGSACNTGNDQFNLKGHKGAYATRAIRYLNSAVEADWAATTALPVAAVGIGLALAGFGAATAIWLARSRR